MKKRNLGKTKIQVSELVLGGGYVGGILLQSDEEAKLKEQRTVKQLEKEMTRLKGVLEKSILQETGAGILKIFRRSQETFMEPGS